LAKVDFLLVTYMFFRVTCTTAWVRRQSRNTATDFHRYRVYGLPYSNVVMGRPI